MEAGDESGRKFSAPCFLYCAGNTERLCSHLWAGCFSCGKTTGSPGGGLGVAQLPVSRNPLSPGDQCEGVAGASRGIWRWGSEGKAGERRGPFFRKRMCQSQTVPLGSLDAAGKAHKRRESFPVIERGSCLIIRKN